MAGCINQTCVALTQLPSSMPVTGSNPRPFDREPSLLSTRPQLLLFLFILILLQYLCNLQFALTITEAEYFL